MIRLAVKKESASIPGAGFHYMLFPMKMESKAQSYIFSFMGYIIIEVEDDVAKDLLDQAKKALLHQTSIAVLADYAERKAHEPR